MSARSVARRAAFLTLLALLACTLAPESVGLRTIQEALRALPSLEMRAAGDWLLPTLHGDPYLAKPPLIYWLTLILQRGLQWIVDDPSVVLALRLVTGIAGACTIPLTYLAGRQILRPLPGEGRREGDAAGDARHADLAAFLGACCLLAGPLHLHQSRTAEIDILTSPLTVIGVWAAVRCLRASGRLAAAWTARAALLAVLTLLALAKGPPAMLVLLIALTVGPLLAAAVLGGAQPSPRGHHLGLVVATALSLIALALFLTGPARTGEPLEIRGIAGAAGASVALGGLGMILTKALTAQRRARLLATMAWRPGTVPLALVALAPLAAWFAAAERAASAGRPPSPDRGADGEAEGTLEQQAGENLVLFVPSAPAEYAEAFAYAAGPGSIAAIAALVWLARDRPWRLATDGPTAPADPQEPANPRRDPASATPFLRSHFFVLAWAIGPVLLFGLLGRGTPRYISAAWPGVALLGGLWLAAAARDLPEGRWIPRVLPPACGVVAAGFSLFWAMPPPALREQSPRELLRAVAEWPGPPAVATWNMWTPALDVHAADLGLEVRGHFVTTDAFAGMTPAADFDRQSGPGPATGLTPVAAGDLAAAQEAAGRIASEIAGPGSGPIPRPPSRIELPPWRTEGGSRRVIGLLVPPPPDAE